MARQKQPIETEDGPLQEETVTKGTGTPLTKPPADDKEIDSYALSVLKTFPSYEFLYIDKQGGNYTPDTPKAIYGNATLYKNPYFKKS